MRILTVQSKIYTGIRKSIVRPSRISTPRRVSPMSVEIMDKFSYHSVLTSGFLFTMIMSMGVIHLAEKSVQPGRDFDVDSTDYDADSDTDYDSEK